MYKNAIRIKAKVDNIEIAQYTNSARFDVCVVKKEELVMRTTRFRKTMFLLLLAALLLANSFPAFAASAEKSGEFELYNEYDYVRTIDESTMSELQEMELSTQEADKIVEEFEKGLVARAALSDVELTALGYTQEEISLLRAFRDGDVLTDAELRAVSGTCTGKFQRNFVLGSKAEFTYIWTWDHCPIFTLSDASAIRWLVYDVNGHEIGVNVIEKHLKVNYHYKALGGIGDFAFTTTGKNQENLDTNAINMQFPVISWKTNSAGYSTECFAKSGSVAVIVQVPAGVQNQIHHITVAGLYGHTTAGIGFPSISVAPHSIGISFTGNLKIDQIAGRKATIYKDRAQIEYW